MQYILAHAGALRRGRGPEQVDKLLRVRGECPQLEGIVYGDPRGLRHYTEPILLSLERLRELGRTFALENPTYFEDQIACGNADDIAVICYTSGTTGSPKGVMLSHRNLIVTGRTAAVQEGLGIDDEVLAYLPMAWVGDHAFSYAQSILAGFPVNCPESADTVLHDLKEIGPTYASPRRASGRHLTNV
jgi:long-chain acyl-CoA synthetase